MVGGSVPPFIDKRQGRELEQRTGRDGALPFSALTSGCSNSECQTALGSGGARCEIPVDVKGEPADSQQRSLEYIYESSTVRPWT